MENFEEIKKLWGETKCADKSAKSVTSEYIDYVISKRIKKVKNNFREYFWASFFYQNLVYGCLAFLIVRYFSRPDIVILSAAGILLYIPFTVMFMKKFKAAFLLNKEGLEYSNDDIWLNLKNSHARMSEFLKLSQISS